MTVSKWQLHQVTTTEAMTDQGWNHKLAPRRSTKDCQGTTGTATLHSTMTRWQIEGVHINMCPTTACTCFFVEQQGRYIEAGLLWRLGAASCGKPMMLSYVLISTLTPSTKSGDRACQDNSPWVSWGALVTVPTSRWLHLVDHSRLACTTANVLKQAVYPQRSCISPVS